MIARSFWGARAGKGSAEKRSEPAGEDSNAPVENLLEARIEKDGSLTEPEAKPRRRSKFASEEGPTVDELDLAVQKLSEGLEAIERQSRAAPLRAPEAPSAEAETGSDRDFVAHSLDRLEARLEALSKRLQQRGGGAPAPQPSARVSQPISAAPLEDDVEEDDVEEDDVQEDDADDIAAQLAESRRLAEAEARAEEEAAEARHAELAERAGREAEAAAEARRRQAILADARRHADAIEAKRQAELVEARRQAELAEARRDVETAEARREAEVAEARRQAEAADVRRKAELAEARREAEAAEIRRQTDLAQAQRQAEAAEAERRAERQAEIAEAQKQAEAAEIRRQTELEQARREAEAAEAERRVEIAEARKQAEIAEARRRAELAQARKQAEAADAKRQAEIAEAQQLAEAAEARRQAEIAEARREAEAAEAQHRAEAEATAEKLRRQAEEAAEERRRMAAEAAEERQRFASEAAEERQRMAEEAEAIRLADLEEARRNAEAAEERRRAEMGEAKRQTDEAQRQAEVATARREAEMAAAIERQFSEVETRIDAMQQGLDDNQVEPVRADLLELVEDMAALSRSGRTTSDALTAIAARLDEMDVKITAARNMAGNRLGDIQDRVGTLASRLDAVEIEIPGFDAVRENQGAILERFDRMEGLVNRLAAAEELLERTEGLKRQLQTTATQRETARIEEQVLKLAERLDAIPAALSDEEALARIETQLGGLAADLVEARRQRKSVAIAFDDHLTEIQAQLREVAETGRAPDLSGIEERLSKLAESVDEDRRAVGDAFARLERRLGDISAQLEAQEDTNSAEVLANLTEKIDSLAAAISAQDSVGARRDISGLDGKLEQLATQLSEHAEHMTEKQIAPIEARLAEMHGQIAEIAKRSQDTSALFRPLVQKLREISDRLAGLETIDENLADLAGKSADPRGLQTQLDAIASRLEVLKGRSIDPARMNELFDRIEFAIRTMPEERFEQGIGEGAISADRLERLEKKIAESAAGASGDRLTRVEQKLDDIARIVSGGGGEFLTQEDLGELRSDITSLRRELRSSPSAGGEPNLGELMRVIAKRLERLPQETPGGIANIEAQIERIAQALDDPENGPAGLAGIHASLRTIEKRLDDTRRSLGYRPPREVGPEASDEETESVAGFARALSEDVSSLKTSAEVSEKKASDAIDAVQDTLEAVVKRMAFLERDADAVGSAQAAPTEEPTEIEAPIEAISEPEPEPEPVAPPSSGGLLGRFTSRQLLRRATGGRAESFSPEPEEAEEASDLPLEPGTDSPLDSSLTGAPSSDTEFMSGARKGRVARARVGDDDAPIVDDDFLAAARRAARAAAAEVGGSDDEESEALDPGARKSRGRGIAAAAFLLAAALVIAALVVARMEVWPYPQVMALYDEWTAAPEASMPAIETAAAPSAAPIFAPSEPVEPAAPSEVAAIPPAPEAPALPPAPDLRQDEVTDGVAATDADDTAPLVPPAPTTDTAATTPASSADNVAMLPPTPGAIPGPEAPATIPAPETPVASLPEAIGSTKLRDAALAGDSMATFEVAARYAEGRGVLQDMRIAVSWYERSANAGLAPAQYRLGSIFEKGLGVPRDLTKAQEWYRRAAEAGNVKAMHNLAVLYAEGAGGEPDLERAAVLFREAAEHGVRDSQFNLAILHARGLGVPQDLVEAYKWFAIAASSGDEESAKRRDIIGQALSDSDRSKAEGLAASFQPLPLVAEANEVQMPDWRSEDGSGDATSVEVKSDNELVALVQKLLAENGYDPGPPDGLLGEKTIEAISAFQGKAGLPRTGQIDTDLVAALQNRST